MAVFRSWEVDRWGAETGAAWPFCWAAGLIWLTPDRSILSSSWREPEDLVAATCVTAELERERGTALLTDFCLGRFALRCLVELPCWARTGTTRTATDAKVNARRRSLRNVVRVKRL